MIIFARIAYYTVAAVLIGCAAVSDVKKNIVRNIYPALIALCGVLLVIFEYLYSGAIASVIFAVSGAFIGFALTAIPAMKGGIGGADVKLSAAAGIAEGLPGILIFMLFTFMPAALFMIGKGVAKKVRRGAELDLKASLPLVPFMLFGITACVLYYFI